MMKQTKQSQAHLKSLIEEFFRSEVIQHPDRYWFVVEKVDWTGRIPSGFRIYAKLHFRKDGSPFCCAEPECHLGADLDNCLGVFLQKAMGVTQDIVIKSLTIHPVIEPCVELKQ